MAVQTERITILGTPDFKAFLAKEAKREGISMSELVRQRCTLGSAGKDAELLTALVAEVSEATAKAKVSLEKGLQDVDQVLQEIRRKQ